MIFRLSCNGPPPRGGQVSPSCVQEMMANSVLADALGSDAAPEPEKKNPVEDIFAIEVADGVAALDIFSIPADETSSAPPASASAAGAKSPPGEDPPAASVAAGTAAAAKVLEDKAATPAAPATQRSAGGDNQRGRKSQAAKQLAASAALHNPLGTTRSLEHSSK